MELMLAVHWQWKAKRKDNRDSANMHVHAPKWYLRQASMWAALNLPLSGGGGGAALGAGVAEFRRPMLERPHGACFEGFGFFLV